MTNRAKLALTMLLIVAALAIWVITVQRASQPVGGGAGKESGLPTGSPLPPPSKSAPVPLPMSTPTTPPK